MADIDLIQVFARLVPGSAYRLDSSAPPHKVLEWRGPARQPTQTEINACWIGIEAEPQEEPLPSLREIYTRLQSVEKNTAIQESA